MVDLSTIPSTETDPLKIATAIRQTVEVLGPLKDKIPTTTTDNAVARFNGTTGALQNSGVTIDDSNNLALPAAAAYFIGANNILGVSGNYTVIQSPATVACTLVFGNTGDPTAYYAATTVNFRTTDNVTTYATFNTSGLQLLGAVAVPAGGTAGTGIKLSSTANLGVFFGSGVPSLSAAQGSLYLRTDGSTTATRLYVNTNGTTGWTNVVTAA